jgi:hypothetical protein
MKKLKENIRKVLRESIDDFDWVKEAKPTFGFFIDQFFRVGGYRAFMEALKDYFGIGETVLLTGDLYLAGGTENSVIKLNQEPFRIMDVNQGKIRVKPIKLSKEHSDMWDSWIGEPYIELGDAKEDREIIIERPKNPILEQDDFDWIRNINPVAFDDFINKAFYFDPTAEEGDEDYAKLVDKLNDLGFSPVYGTTSFVGEGNYIAGLFSYLDFDRNPKYVFTHDDYDTRTWDGYEEHIKGYALGESEARDDLEVVDARAFITQFT